MSSFLQRWLPLAFVALIALWLRTQDIARRPMHSDEANQAVKFGDLLETGHYAFDPHDHHGPTLYYAALPIAWLRGEHTLAALSETTVRLVPAIFGTLSVLLLFALAAPLSAVRSSVSTRPELQPPAPSAAPPFAFAPLAAAAFLAGSPPAVYYSRYFIQETLLVTFTLGALVCTQHWWRTGRFVWALAAGVGIGLMQATKASAPLFLVAALLAALAARVPRPTSTHLRRDLTLAVVTALVVAALFFSSFGTHLAGLRDAAFVYRDATHRTLGPGAHVKPWWYFLRLFAWFTDGGLTFNQLGFSALALCGVGLAWITRQKFLRWAAVYTFTLVLVLSLTPYKTPWHTIHLVPGLALLAAGALANFPRRWIAWLILAIVLLSQLSQTRLTSFLRPADPRNPWAYVHSSPDVTKFRPLADAALAGNPNGILRVIGEEYWPLPWYFRGLSRVGYWSTPPADCDGALVIASASSAETVRARLHGAYRETYLGLRPGFVCVVFTPAGSALSTPIP